jgi:hypothetical protein
VAVTSALVAGFIRLVKRTSSTTYGPLDFHVEVGAHQPFILAMWHGQFMMLADLNTPLLTSKTDAQREAELTRVNGKLYTIAKVQSDKSCPAVANGPPSAVVR